MAWEVGPRFGPRDPAFRCPTCRTGWGPDSPAFWDALSGLEEWPVPPSPRDQELDLDSFTAPRAGEPPRPTVTQVVCTHSGVEMVWAPRQTVHRTPDGRHSRGPWTGGWSCEGGACGGNHHEEAPLPANLRAPWNTGGPGHGTTHSCGICTSVRAEAVLGCEPNQEDPWRLLWACRDCGGVEVALAEQCSWFTTGPLALLGTQSRLYGWEPGRPLTAPGDRTQSWLFMPLIALALEDLEAQQGLPAHSIGSRDPVPPAQAQFWRDAVQDAANAHPEGQHLLAALTQALGAWPLAAHAVHEAHSWNWRWGNDHLEGNLQERLLSPLEDTLTVLWHTW